MIMDDNPIQSFLTNDEKNAAEAAFARRAFNPKWSARARLVYDGIVKALPMPPEEVVEEATATSDLAATLPTLGEIPTPQTTTPPQEQPLELTDKQVGNQETLAVPIRIPFKQALETGALIDVTSTARQLGFSFPVTVTKPLWEVGIAPPHTVTQEEQSGRLRDVLMAFRLRLATQPTISPLIDFAALLAFAPNSVPQPMPLFALIQPDEQNRAMVTLLLPNEVSTSIIPMN
jgi:Family of unknown function (DUF6573)